MRDLNKQSIDPAPICVKFCEHYHVTLRDIFRGILSTKSTPNNLNPACPCAAHLAYAYQQQYSRSYLRRIIAQRFGKRFLRWGQRQCGI